MMEKNTKNTIKTIYLYIFSVIGLILLVIGTVGLVNLVLKSVVFTKADDNYYDRMPPMPYGLEKVQDAANSSEFTSDEQASVRAWLQDYESWKAMSDANDAQKSQNQRDTAQNIALILVGLPLYLYHWRLTKKLE